jgi:hypothetical protein
MVPAIREVVNEFDPSIPVFGVRSWDEALAIALFPARAATIALGIFGVLALMLAIGVFGLASYTLNSTSKMYTRQPEATYQSFLE